MKKKIVIFLMAICAIVCLAVGCETSVNGDSATESETFSGEISNTITESELEGARNLIEFKTLSVDGEFVFGKVANTTTKFSFVDEIIVKGGGDFKLSREESGGFPFQDKSPALTIGDNVFYVFQTVNDVLVKTYTVTIRRRPYYMVTFNTERGEEFFSQRVEEDGLVTAPQDLQSGIAKEFKGWDYDFTQPITSDISINPIFAIPEEMSNFEFYSTQTDCEIVAVKDKAVTEINIPSYVTAIGDYAFTHCDGINSISFPDSVTAIGAFAFEQCDNLAIVELPKNLKTMGSLVFLGCQELESVEIWDIAKWCQIDGDLFIGGDVLRLNGKKLSGELVIPTGVTEIPKGAFSDCDGLTSVILPESVIVVGDSAFNYCDNLLEFTSLGNLEKIGNHAFSDCGKLSNVEIPDSVTDIGNGAFYACYGLKNIVAPIGVTKIAASTYANCIGLTSVAIGENIKVIEDRAFYNCSELVTVEISDSVTTLGVDVFALCAQLTTVKLGSGIKEIGSAFVGCSSLTGIIIPEGVETLGNYAFSECSSFTYIVLPKSLNTLGYCVFIGLDQLSSIYYMGTASEWEKINKDLSLNELNWIDIYFYIENEQDVPTDGGKYWHYDEMGNPATW